MKIYADSSFFVSVYLRDSHSPEVFRRIRTDPEIWFTPFHRLEFAHALAQNVYRGSLSAADCDALHRSLERDCDAGVWNLTGIPQAAFDTGFALARKYVARLGTRTLDTLHVACALELKADRFWTFDLRQSKLARAAGLKTS